MFIYNVTINIDNDVADEWLLWMTQKHIPDVLKTGCFTEHRILRVLADEESGGKTYSVQYFFDTMQDIETYESCYAAELRDEHTQKYKDKFVAFRTLLHVIK
ncbi:MAG: DUF4286 family protein [Bacteroidetes bacterium]|jgi:hypothetical protein|nr:DUF4286 family protein [Bacteroidota bacterium]